MTLAIITTTINVPHNLQEWSQQLGKSDYIIVAGDLKTPHDAVMDLLDALPCRTVYLHPDDQYDWQTSAVVGWNTIQRRNVALLEAMKVTRPGDIIITIDDDNYPTNSSFVQLTRGILNGRTTDHVITQSYTGWFNAGSLLTPSVVHRGFPLSRRHEMPEAQTSVVPARMGVFAALWLGDPDIDAIERIAKAPEVVSMPTSNVILAPGTWCPFNSQATAYLAELAPLMMVWPGVGRFDDIWSSYVARRVMDHLGWSVQYGHPLVRQERNAHNLIRDLEAELFGYRYTEQFCDVLRDITFNNDDVIDCLARCTVDMIGDSRYSFIPGTTQISWNAWLSDVKSLRSAQQ